MATTTVKDEPTRAALTYSLWAYASRAVGEDLYNGLMDLADEAIRDGDPARAERIEVTRDAVAMLSGVTEAVARVREATLGELVEIPVPLPAIARELESCAHDIEEDRGVLSLSGAEREKMIAIHDAAATLFAQFGETAVA